MGTRAHVAAKTLREWLEKNQVNAAELARRCSSGPLHFDRKRIGELLACTHVRADLLAEIERVTAGEVPASLWLEEAAPPSETRPRELGNTRDELRATVQEIDAVRRKGGLSPTQEAALIGKRTSALMALARQEDRCALEDHPDFEVHIDDVLQALEATISQFGVNPTGARSAFADHLERIEAERQRRAA